MCRARGTTVPMITAPTSPRLEAFEFQKLVEPDRIFVGRRRGSVAIRQQARITVIDERENDIGVAGIDGEKHGCALKGEAARREVRQAVAVAATGCGDCRLAALAR